MQQLDIRGLLINLVILVAGLFGSPWLQNKGAIQQTLITVAIGFVLTAVWFARVIWARWTTRSANKITNALRELKEPDKFIRNSERESWSFTLLGFLLASLGLYIWDLRTITFPIPRQSPPLEILFFMFCILCFLRAYLSYDKTSPKWIDDEREFLFNKIPDGEKREKAKKDFTPENVTVPQPDPPSTVGGDDEITIGIEGEPGANHL